MRKTILRQIEHIDQEIDRILANETYNQKIIKGSKLYDQLGLIQDKIKKNIPDDTVVKTCFRTTMNKLLIEIMEFDANEMSNRPEDF